MILVLSDPQGTLRKVTEGALRILHIYLNTLEEGSPEFIKASEEARDLDAKLWDMDNPEPEDCGCACFGDPCLQDTCNHCLYH